MYSCNQRTLVLQGKKFFAEQICYSWYRYVAVQQSRSMKYVVQQLERSAFFAIQHLLQICLLHCIASAVADLIYCNASATTVQLLNCIAADLGLLYCSSYIILLCCNVSATKNCSTSSGAIFRSWYIAMQQSTSASAAIHVVYIAAAADVLCCIAWCCIAASATDCQNRVYYIGVGRFRILGGAKV